jgi:hypothetical protein
VAAGCCGGRRRQWLSRARRGKPGGASCRRRLGGANARDGMPNDGLWRAGDGGVLAVPRRKVLIMALASGLPRANGCVQEGAEAVVITRARREDEGRTSVIRRGGVLRRPVPCQGALTACLAGFWRVWARFGWPMPCMSVTREGTSILEGV